jgi:AcrR family transcriptional regulator
MTSDLSTADDRRGRIVAAAIAAFSCFGYRRCAMADIAAAAGMSRPALYLVFSGKEAVLRAVAAQLLADAAANAEAAWPPESPVAAGLAAAILAKDLAIHRLIMASPHAAEILAVATDLAGDLHATSAARYQALLASRLRAAGHRDPDETARMIVHASTGLKHAGLPEADYIADVHRLALLLAVPMPADN